MIWKIDDFERRRKEAVDSVTMSLYSSAFCMSRYSYKIFSQIYLNGDGLGKNTHFSSFFVIMRGPYDALLQWPFRQKVTLTLPNQIRKRHITDHFRPDPHSSSFQHPGKREMNIASGCPMFIEIEYLLDDTAFIRIVVDASLIESYHDGRNIDITQCHCISLYKCTWLQDVCMDLVRTCTSASWSS